MIANMRLAQLYQKSGNSRLQFQQCHPCLVWLFCRIDGGGGTREGGKEMEDVHWNEGKHDMWRVTHDD